MMVDTPGGHSIVFEHFLTFQQQALNSIFCHGLNSLGSTTLELTTPCLVIYTSPRLLSYTFQDL